MRKALELKYDFIVIGGGLAGICAGIAAARKGVKTALIQDRPVLGGNSSSEIRVPPSGSVQMNSWSMETGLIEEILLKERAENPDILFTGYVNSIYDNCLYDIVKSQDNLDLFLNTVVRNVEVESCAAARNVKVKVGNSLPEDKLLQGYEKTIKALYAVQLGSGQEIVFYADQFADCTGDGEIGFMAGAAYRYGREGRCEYNENLAPIKPDNEVLGATITFLARRMAYPVEFTPPMWAKKIRSDADIGYMRDLGIGAFGDGVGDVYAGYWWLEIGAPYHQVYDITKVKEELLAYIMGIWDYIKNYSDQKEKAKNYTLEWIGAIPGKRESRRLLGDVVVTQANCQKDEQWSDRICYAGWSIDLHVPGGIFNKTAPPERGFIDNNYKEYTLVAPFTIPLRSCYSKNVSNLWMAGRNISVSHVALSSVRVQCTLANVSQAVGIAAAHAIKSGATPREVAQSPNIQIIQQEIIKDDVHIPGIRNNDKKDLALLAEVKASSEQCLYLDHPNMNVYEKLDMPRGQVFPVTHNVINTVEVFINNDNVNDISEGTEVKVQLHELCTIWDQDDGKLVAEKLIKIPPGFHGWFPIHFNTTTTPGKPHRLSLGKASGISWAHSLYQDVGTLAQYQYSCEGGCEAKNISQPILQPDEVDIPAFKRWNNYGWRKSFSFAMRILPTPTPYGGSNVNNGYAWPYDMPNIWISDRNQKLPQYVELDFKEAKEFNTVIISFDTNLNLLHSYMPGKWRSPVCAKEWAIYARVDTNWILICKEDNNFQRRRVVTFDTVKASALKIEVLKTNAGEDAENHEKNCARIYEVRVYKR